MTQNSRAFFGLSRGRDKPEKREYCRVFVTQGGARSSLALGYYHAVPPGLCAALGRTGVFRSRLHQEAIESRIGIEFTRLVNEQRQDAKAAQVTERSDAAAAGQRPVFGWLARR